MQGRYLNPKYARRKRYRRKTAMTVVALTLSFCCLCAIYSVDVAIRTTMLPSAPPVAQVERQELHLYEVTLFGREMTVSTLWVAQLGDQMRALLATPPAPIRLGYQVRALITGQVPRNLRPDPKVSTGV